MNGAGTIGHVPTVADDGADRASARVEHEQVLAAGAHLLQQLDFRDVPDGGADFTVELDLDARIKNPRGGLQGGLMATLVDVAAGRAVLAGGPTDSVATADLAIHFLRGLTVGPARATATVVRRGRSLAVVTVEVTDVSTGELCAVSTLTFSIVAAGATTPGAPAHPTRPSTVQSERPPAGDQPTREH
ncbi:MAG: PaaI family thioesterase [Acidimicrobiales bacterium]